ncbi:MAG: hypothetical protein ACLP66_03700 [Polyangia bacterium]
MKRPDEKPTVTDELLKGTATGLPAMKRPYEKPTLTDLDQEAKTGRSSCPTACSLCR